MTYFTHVSTEEMLRICKRIFTSVQTQRSIQIQVPLRFGAFLTSSADPQPSTMEHIIYKAPSEVRGMTSLDKEAFAQTVVVPALRVPKGIINKVVKSLKKSIIHRPNVSRVIEDKENDGETDEFRLVLLDPHVVTSPTSFSEAETETLRSLGVPQELQSYELRLAYDNLKSDEILRAVLPEGQDVNTGFSRVGHIVHMNLRDHQLPYKHLIGQVIMDKNPGVTCVVNKTNNIDSTYRFFKMELLAGEENMLAKVKENGITYEFDFSLVYWNPRLCTEHERVVKLLKSGDMLLDVFAGVGPFTIPAARRGVVVHANDLNPESYRWLQHNCKLNKVQLKVKTFNLDGRAFIQGPVKEVLPALLRGTAKVHVCMNLPALALEFLDAFRGLLAQESSDIQNLPMVHCYGFSKEDDPKKDMVQRASVSLGFPLEGRCSVHLVRNVAPNKEMLCVSFTLPKEVLFSQGDVKTDPTEEPAPKRQKCEETTD